MFVVVVVVVVLKVKLVLGADQFEIGLHSKKVFQISLTVAHIWHGEPTPFYSFFLSVDFKMGTVAFNI